MSESVTLRNVDLDCRGSVEMVNATSVSYLANSITNAAVSTTAAIARTKLAQDALQVFGIPLGDWRIWDSASRAVLPNTSATDDLGLIVGAFSSASHVIRTYDVKTVGATALYARTQFILPPEYDGGESISFRAYAQMVTTVADTSCTIDMQAYKHDKEAGISADLVTTTATSMNTLTGANYDFVITPTGLAAGDTLDLRIHIAPNDGAGGTAVIAEIGFTGMLLDIKG